MKKILSIILLCAVVQTALAQNTYKTTLTNSESSTIEISLNADEVIIEGMAGNEIIIEGSGNVRDDRPKPPPIPGTKPEDTERSKGLKPLGPEGNDNTGLGITVGKTENHVSITSGQSHSGGKFKIMVPDKAKINLNNMHIHFGGKNDFRISNTAGEITATGLNSNFKLENITGPLVITATNGNVEVAYASIKTKKPISIVSVNGFVDLTLPSTIKADLNLQTVNGKAYSDFEVKSNSEEPSVTIPYMELFHMDGKINGGGDVKIEINAVNGDIYLRKK